MENNTTGDLINVDKYLVIFDALYYTSDDTEVLLKSLREAGASPIHSIRVLMIKLGITLREADDIILNSATWMDVKEDVIKFRKAFEDEWKKQANEDGSIDL
jgi:choline kinase